MTLTEALQILRSRSGPSSAAYDRVSGFVHGVAHKHSNLRGDDLDDVVSDTMRRLIGAMEVGRFDPQVEAAVSSYVFRAARNAARSLMRRQVSDQKRTDREQDVDALVATLGTIDDGDEWDEDPAIVSARARGRARDHLDRLAERALRRRKPANRKHLQVAYDQLVAIRLDGSTVDEYVGRELGAGADDAAMKRERDRIYKAHERCRAALRDALMELVNEGSLPPEDAAQSEGCLRLL